MASYPHCLVSIEGRTAKCVFPPFVSQECLDQLWEEFEPKADDVFICAYPKSGTTWVEQICHLLRNSGAQGDQVLSEAIPFLEGAAKRYNGLQPLINKMGSQRRFFHSHLPFALLPKDKGKDSESPYIVYVVRNPKDVAVSFYYHSCSKMNYQGSWDEFFELFTSGQIGYGGVFDHVIEWWRASRLSENRILVVSYEQLHQDLRGSVQSIAAFLGINATSDLIDRVVDQSTFENMSQNSKANLSWVPQRAGVPTHMRKGKVGDWRTMFSSIQQERFERIMDEKLGNDEFSELRNLFKTTT